MSPELKLYAERAKYGPGWIAYIEGEDDLGPDNLCGWGATEAEAVADLLEQLDEDKRPMCHADLVPDYNYCRACAEVVR